MSLHFFTLFSLREPLLAHPSRRQTECNYSKSFLFGQMTMKIVRFLSHGRLPVFFSFIYLYINRKVSPSVFDRSYVHLVILTFLIKFNF